MLFAEILKKMKNTGEKVKLPSWGGYWFWDAEKETIYYSRTYERYFIIYDKDNVHEVKVTDCFDYPKRIY